MKVGSFSILPGNVLSHIGRFVRYHFYLRVTAEATLRSLFWKFII